MTVTDDGEIVYRLSTEDAAGAPASRVIRLTSGKVYRVEFSLSGTSGAGAKLCVKEKSPLGFYECNGTNFITLAETPSLRAFDVVIKPDSVTSKLYLQLKSAGTLDIHSVEITDVTQESLAAQAKLNTPVKGVAFGVEFRRLAQHYYWPRMGQKLVRVWGSNVGWNAIEPSRNGFTFAPIESQVSFVEQNCSDCKVMLKLGMSPTWAADQSQKPSAWKDAPAGNSPPRDIEDWKRYVAAVTSHFKGRIAYYQVWNEVNLSQFWTGSMAQMVELTAAAYEILKREDPNAKMLSPSFSAYGFEEFEEFLRLGGVNTFDIVSFHFYVNAGSIEEYLLQYHVVRDIANRYIDNVEIWNSESAVNVASAESDNPKATNPGLVARLLISNYLTGFRNLNYYYYSRDDRGLPLSNKDYSEGLGATAYRMATEWIGGHEVSVQSRDEGVTVLKVSTKDGSFLLIWSDNGDEKNYNLWSNSDGFIAVSATGVIEDVGANNITVVDGSPKAIYSRTSALAARWLGEIPPPNSLRNDAQ